VQDTIDRFMCFDLNVHGWDLASAAALPYSIADDEIARVRSDVDALGDAIRSPNVVGPPIDPPAGATAQDQLLAYLGRDPNWNG
jgi:hypothetical protein